MWLQHRHGVRGADVSSAADNTAGGEEGSRDGDADDHVIGDKSDDDAGDDDDDGNADKAGGVVNPDAAAVTSDDALRFEPESDTISICVDHADCN